MIIYPPVPKTCQVAVQKPATWYPEILSQLWHFLDPTLGWGQKSPSPSRHFLGTTLGWGLESATIGSHFPSTVCLSQNLCGRGPYKSKVSMNLSQEGGLTVKIYLFMKEAL